MTNPEIKDPEIRRKVAEALWDLHHTILFWCKVDTYKNVRAYYGQRFPAIREVGRIMQKRSNNACSGQEPA
jgi:alkylated DNA nucleotide flippase Atl1